MQFARLVAVAVAIVGAGLASAASSVLELGPNADRLDWQPLAAHHVNHFFRTPAGWTEDSVHRRLEESVAGTDELQRGRQSLQDFADRIRPVVPTTITTLEEDTKRALNWGKAYNGIYWNAFTVGLHYALAGVTAGLSFWKIDMTFAALAAAKQQMREVFDALAKIHLRVEALPDFISYQLDRNAYRDLINNAGAQSSTILNQLDSPGALRASCRSFKNGMVGEVVHAMESFPRICLQPGASSAVEQRKCYLTVGQSVGASLAQLQTAMSICVGARETPFVSDVSAAELRTASMLAANFFGDLAGRINKIDSVAANATLDDELKQYRNATAENILNEKASGPSADSLIKAMVDGMNTYNFAGKDYAQKIANFTAQEAWLNLTASNPEAREMATAMALAIGFKYDQKGDRLSKLDDKIYETHQERVQLVSEADAKVWDYHGKIMNKVETMGTTFTAQSSQRIEKLNGIQSKVTTIQSNVNTGFASLKGQLDGMRQQWGNQITDIDNEIVKQGGQTSSFLSNAVIDAAEQVGNRIAGVQDQVVRTHNEVMGALQTTQQRNEQEFVATKNTLQQSSGALRETIDQGMYALDSTVRQAFDAVSDAVARRLEEAHAHLGDMVTGISRELAFVDNKLMVFENQVEDMSRQLETAKLYLHDINTVFDSIAKALADLPASIRAEIFKDRYDHLEDQYIKIRDGYNDYVSANLTASIMVGSCIAHRPYDLFLSFLELVDISDADIPRQLERFGNSVATYERFGLVVLGILKELAFLDSICATLQFGATFRELQIKAQEQDDRIVAASATLVRHVEEMIPAYLLHVRAASLVESYSIRDWTTQGASLAEALRRDLQDSVGAFARVSVVHAGLSGTLTVKHLDANFDYVNAKVARRRGIQVSKNKKLAAMWGATKQLPSVAPASLDSTTLLRQGIFRGNVTASPPTNQCFLALASGFYPVCDRATCACSHYEDFASETDPTAGRAVTRFASNDYTSDFVVEAVDEAGVDYALEAVAFSVSQLPSLKAFAALRAPTRVALNTSQPLRPVWEGYTDLGKFEVAVSDVAGVVLTKNELVFDVEMISSDQTIRHTFPLFCDSKLQQATVESWLVLRYACKEVARVRPPSASGNGSTTTTAARYPLVVPGAPVNRLGLAVCATAVKTKTCVLSGEMDLTAASAGSTLAFGSQVQDVTLFQKSGLEGDFVICRGCSTADLAAVKEVGSVAIGVPGMPPAGISLECGTPAGRPNMLYCRRLPTA